MKSTKINTDVQKTLRATLKKYPVVVSACEHIKKAGGRALLVGGAVRDLFLGIEIKDLDIEVYGLSLEQLQSILKQCGPVSLVGKSFGVLRVHGLDVDWSLPRADSAGRKPRVIIDPHMSFRDAFARRDLTINAMGIDILTQELIDPWDGVSDLHKKILRSPQLKFFSEDPLRLFRVMQFISRFEFSPDQELNNICKTMSIEDVSRERIEQEFEKLVCKSKRPSLGIRWLHEIGRLREVMPELADTIGVEQGEKWHPEGDVFEHSMQALDAAAHLPYESKKKLIMMYAALMHDLGKVTTSFRDGDEVHSYGHEQAGVACAKSLLKRITHDRDIIDPICKLIANHMAPGQLAKANSSLAAYRRLAVRLAPDVTLEMLADLALADYQGRNPNGPLPLIKHDFQDLAQFRAQAKKARVFHKPEEPILQGRDLLDVVKPGPKLGKLLAHAYEIQLDEGIQDKDELRRRVLSKK